MEGSEEKTATHCVCVVRERRWSDAIEVDFNGVHCDVLKEFMECSNLRNIEVLSFMSERGLWE